jgi:pyruvate/2-oxoglutarate dehydrogenase complex dihydrolipoamide acyltransferase (E2) component
VPRVPIELPDLGAARAVLSLWYARVGDRVFAGDRVAEVLIPGATVDVPAPADGVLASQAVLANDALVAGQVIGEIQSDE